MALGIVFLAGLLGFGIGQPPGPMREPAMIPEEMVGGMLSALRGLQGLSGAPLSAKDKPSELEQAIAAKDAARVRSLLHEREGGPPPDRKALSLAIATHDVGILRMILDAGAAAKDLGPESTVSPLTSAVFLGDRAVVEEFLAWGASPFVKDARSMSLLAGSHMFPAYSKESHTAGSSLLTERYARAALGEGADHDYVVGCGVTRLMALAYLGDLAGVRHELEQGADVAAADSGRWTAIKWAAAGPGDQSAVTAAVLAKGASLASGASDEQSPLSIAVAFSEIGTVRALLPPDPSGPEAAVPLSQALARAIAYDREDVFAILMARSDLPAYGLDHAADWAMGAEQPQRLKRILEWRPDGLHQGKPGELLVAAISRKNKDFVQLLLDHATPLAFQTSGGWTPFSVVTTVGDDDIFGILLEAAKKRGELGTLVGGKRVVDDALLHAANSGRLEMCRRLLEEGADVNIIDTNGTAISPLWYAAGGGHLEVVRFLLEHGAKVRYPDPRAKPEEGTVDVIVPAARKGGVELIQTLLRAGSDPNAGGLTYALSFRNEVAAQALIEAGADVNVIWGGRSILTHAIQLKQPGFVRILLNGGASIAKAGDYPDSPLESARQTDQREHSAETAEILRLMEEASSTGGSPSTEKP